MVYQKCVSLSRNVSDQSSTLMSTSNVDPLTAYLPVWQHIYSYNWMTWDIFTTWTFYNVSACVCDLINEVPSLCGSYTMKCLPMWIVYHCVSVQCFDVSIVQITPVQLFVNAAVHWNQLWLNCAQKPFLLLKQTYNVLNGTLCQA